MTVFKTRGYRVVAVAPVVGDFDSSLFEGIGVEFKPWSLKGSGLNPLSDLLPILLLWRIIRDVRPGILFAHTAKAVIYGLIVSWLAGVPRRVAMIPGLGYAFSSGGEGKRKFSEAIATLGYRAALARAHMVIFQNHDDLNMLRAKGVLSPTAAVGVVNGSGVDMDRFDMAPWPAGPPSFLMLARLLKDKGVLQFVEAARIVRRTVPDARFVLAGGTYPNPSAISQKQIDEWVSEGLIEAPGQLKDPKAAFAACHVFVLPSFYGEGCPRVNLEAMSMGRAIVTTDSVGCRDTVDDGVNGLLVPPRDSQSLATALLTLALDLGKARAMGEAGRKLCRRKFELSAVAEATASLVAGTAFVEAS